jgi:hypothetical protein
LILDGALDHDLKIVVVFLADRCVAGIDPVFGQGARRSRELFEQQVAVVVEVADDGDAEAALVKALDDVRNGCGGVLIVDRDANDLRARERTSAVSVLVIDCTTTGTSQPTRTCPILTVPVFLR